MRLDRQGGLEALLEHPPRTGRQQSLPQWAQAALNQRFKPEGFERDGALCQYLERQLGISAPYKTVQPLVPYRLKASPKVARPVSVSNTDVRVEAEP